MYLEVLSGLVTQALDTVRAVAVFEAMVLDCPVPVPPMIVTDKF